jgi:hypothetical protein
MAWALEGPTETMKMLVLEVTNQNEKLYAQTSLGTQESKCGPPTVLSKDKKKLKKTIIYYKMYL